MEVRGTRVWKICDPGRSRLHGSPAARAIARALRTGTRPRTQRAQRTPRFHATVPSVASLNAPCPNAAASSSGTPAPKQPRPTARRPPRRRARARTLVLNGRHTLRELAQHAGARVELLPLAPGGGRRQRRAALRRLRRQRVRYPARHMRIGVLTLPQNDEALCIRVLMQAESLGWSAARGGEAHGVREHAPGQRGSPAVGGGL